MRDVTDSSVNALRRHCRPLSALVGLVLLTGFDVLSQPATAPKRVLLLHSYGQDLAPYSDLSLVFRDELTQNLGEPVDLVEVSLVTAGAGASLGDQPFVDYLQALLVGRKPDLVVPIGAIASSFAQRQRQRLFPDVPTLYAAVDDRTLDRYALTDKDTVVASRLDVHGFVQNILDVLPETAHVAVIVGASPVEQFWKVEAQREFEPFMNQIEFIWLDQLTFEEMKQAVAELPPNSAILYAVLIVDAAGIPRPLTGGLQDIHDAANAPVFGVYVSNIDRGVVGGRLVSDRELGRSAASVAIRVLYGESPGAIKTPPLGPGTPVYNWKELQRWGIKEANLPSGSDVRLREPTAWEQYRSYLAAGVAIVLLQSALIAGLFWQRLRRRRAERETASLGGRLLMVHENERRRVARELHDDVTQRLAALAIDATRIEGPHGVSADEATRSIRDGLSQTERGCSRALLSAASFGHRGPGSRRGAESRMRPRYPLRSRHRAIQREGDSPEIASRYGAVSVPCRTGGTTQCRPTCRGKLRRSFRFTAGRRTAACGQRQRHRFRLGRNAERPSLGLASIRERVNLLKGQVDIDSGRGYVAQRCSHGSPGGGFEMNRARVLLADDHRLVAEGLKTILTAEFDLVGVVEDGRALIAATKTLRPDVIVSDITMPNLTGSKPWRS